MYLFVALFGYLGVVVHGLVLATQSMMLGGVLFLVFLLRPLVGVLVAGAGLERRVARLTMFSASRSRKAVGTALQVSVLMNELGLPFANVIQAPFALAGGVQIGCALLLAGCFGRYVLPLPGGVARARRGRTVAATFTTHAYARLDHTAVLLTAEGLHQLGVAIWIGGIPCFVLVLGRLHDVDGWRSVGVRFSRMAMLGVACIVLSVRCSACSTSAMRGCSTARPMA